MSPNPLTEANPKSLDELYLEDSLGLTDSDVDRLVADLVAKRALWAQEDAEAQKNKKSGGGKKKSYREPPAKGTLTLDLLGLTMEPRPEGDE